MKYIIIIGLFLSSCSDPLFKKTNTLTKEFGVTTLEINSKALSDIQHKKQPKLTIKIPIEDSSYQADLQILNLGNYKVLTPQGEKFVNKGLFYSGELRGVDSSQITISILNGEIQGLLSSPSLGNISLGKLGNLYAASVDGVVDSFSCEVESIPMKALNEIEKLRPKTTFTTNALKCITIDEEVTYDTYLNKGSSVQAVTDWITTIFAAEKTFYSKDGISIQLGTLYINTQPDGYSTVAGTALNQVGTKRKTDPNFKGDLFQLIRGKTGGAASGIAYVGSLCVPTYRFSYAEPYFNFTSYPSYSWSLNVTAHELGHLLGSEHTQSCSWPGGPIDGCVAPEGTCNPGPIPTQGTLMSYCHLLSYVGINFSLGLGALPKAKILSYINNLCFVGSCTTVPTVPNPNIAIGKPVLQSSDYSSILADRAVDGNPTTFSHTNMEVNPWLQVDLQSIKNIKYLELINRLDCCGYRLRRFRVFINNTPWAVGLSPEQASVEFNKTSYIYEFNNSNTPNGFLISIPANTSGRYIKVIVQNFSVGDYFSVAELRVFENLTPCKDSIIKLPNPITYRDSVICK